VSPKTPGQTWESIRCRRTAVYKTSTRSGDFREALRACLRFSTHADIFQDCWLPCGPSVSRRGVD